MLLACPFAQDGVEVVFPDGGSVFFIFLKLKGGDLDIEVGRGDKAPLEIGLGFC